VSSPTDHVSPSPQLPLTAGGGGGETALAIEGELSIANAKDLHQLLSGFPGQGPDLVVDLAGVRECDAAALQLIWSLRQTAIARCQRLRIAALSPAVEKAAAAIGLPIGELSADGGAAAGTAPEEGCRGV
jgi:anti-anti-sigma regulatory factor